MLNNRLHIILFILIFLASLLELKANSNTDEATENSTPSIENSSSIKATAKDKRAAKLLKKEIRKQKKDQRLPRKEIKKRIKSGAYDDLSYNQTNEEFPVEMPEKEELEKMLQQVLNSQAQDFRIGGGEEDSLGDVGGILDEELALIKKGRAVIAKIKELNNYVPYLTGQSMIELPVGISKTIGNETYTVGIANIGIHPTHAQLEVYMEIESPKLDSALMFYSPNIKFSNAGAFVGDVGLGLLGDFVVHIAKKKSAINFKRGVSNADGMFTGGTYVYFGCDGFEELSVDATVYFSRDWLLPVSGDSINVDSTQRVTGDFQIVVGSLDDIIANVDFSMFVIKGWEEVRWDLEPMVFDFSDTRSDPAVMFPDDYPNPIAGDDMWKGFYTSGFKVYLPRKLKKSDAEAESTQTGTNTGTNTNTNTSADNSTSIVVHGENIIIDNLGFTGRVSTYNIIELKEGNLDGWAFSIDTVRLDVMANQFREFNFSGMIHLPILKDKDNTTDSVGVKDCLAYKGTITYENKYNFEVSALGNYGVDIWKAEVTIKEGSTLIITNDDAEYEGEFLTEATLHGDIQVAGDDGFTKGLKVEQVTFENLVLRNQKSYIEPGSWSFPKVTVKMGAFQLTLEDIAFMNYGDEEDDETALTFDGLVSLAPSDGAGITACGSFAFIGNMVESNDRQRWKYDRMKIDEIFINASAPGFGISGGLTFYENHETFGNGFRGMISVWVAGVNEDEGMEEQSNSNQVSCFGSPPDDVDFGISAMAQFGSVDINGVTEDYFFVDLQAKFGATGIPLIPGILKLTALGGGIYHKMDRDENYLEALVNASTAEPGIPELGTSLSGIKYEPDANVGLGIRLSAGFATMTESMLNGNVFFEMQFNNTGGLNFILIQGTAQMLKQLSLAKIPKFAQDTSIIKAPDIDASIRAYVSILFDFQNDIFDAQFRMYLTTPGNIVTGAGDGNVLGWAHILVNENGWFVKIGEPENRCGIKINIGDILAIHFDAYFCVGSMEIPDIPPPPDGVLSMMGYSEGDPYDPKRSGLVSTGAGLAFGASFGFDTGDLTFLIFYGNFQMTLGFDISILDYGEAYCVNTNEPIGFDGWYATGQIYAGVGAEVGVTAKIFGKRIKATILKATAGVILQASLPNPFYGRGILGGTYEVLGGLLKGTWRFELELGEQCQIAGASNPAIVPIINRIVPEDGAEVGVDFSPLVEFLVPVEDEYQLTGLDGEDEYYKVKIVDENTGLYLDGEKISGLKNLSSDKRSMTWDPYDMLRGNREYMFIVEVRFQEKEGYYTWNDVYEDGKLAVERDTIIVTTGPGLLTLPDANVKNSYPYDEQFNYYENEHYSRSGAINLHKGQADMFEHIDDDVSYKIKVKARENDYAWYIEPNIGNFKYISWKFPEGLFDREKLYSMELVYIDDNTLSKGTSHADYIELAEEELGQYAYYFDPNPPVAQQHHTVGHAGGDGGGPNPGGTTTPTTNTNTPHTQTVDPSGGEGTSSPPPLRYKSVYKVYFRTSKYLKLKDKLAQMPVEEKGAIFGANIYTTYKLDEPFGVHEVEKFVIDRSDDSDWFKNRIKKNFYDKLQCFKDQYGSVVVDIHEWKSIIPFAWGIKQNTTVDGKGSNSTLDKLKITSYVFNHNKIPEYNENTFATYRYDAPLKIRRHVSEVTTQVASLYDYNDGPHHEPLDPNTSPTDALEAGFRSCWKSAYKSFLYYYNFGELPPPGDTAPLFFMKAYDAKPSSGTYKLKFKYDVPGFYSSYTVNIVTP